ncbi:BZ3500_MvSof-1268-A1-R1_Chr2-2g04992 [Microbotryum saponariae]|uniref:BZ3500_MvSof-1268-A1-R1_Chr2-2g04992 protein n=1 Tax=Microbotryum saponariae TaxID=289078 RepID=A0A2X0KAJ7_9BASI|nr:BZ3500_MvSof-1268-A1-R1_Chr2-2g04992 [Microbotryum saponariae]SDA00658.1 BZ3501_MvSof-1269-A2-R1_Chr2-2g04666 [Microbotryum saponariae]
MDAELAVLLFGITLAVEVVGWVGADSIAAFLPLPPVYLTRIPFYAPVSRFSSNPTLKSQKALRADIIKLRAELAATSSVDEFSKWAKLRRRVDKAVSELEALNATSSQSRQSFQSLFKRILWIFTTILPFVVTSWHRKAAVFYLPPSWFGPATWWLGLPSAPTGSSPPWGIASESYDHSTDTSLRRIRTGAVACGVWTMACKRTIGACKDAIVDLTQKEARVAQPVPVAVPAQPVSSEKAESKEGSGVEGKKEL